MRFAALALAVIAATANAASMRRRLATATGMVCHMYAPEADITARVLVSNGDWAANVTDLAYKSCKSYEYDDTLTGLFTFKVFNEGGEQLGSALAALPTGKPLTVLTTRMGATGVYATSSGLNVDATASAWDMYNAVQDSESSKMTATMSVAGQSVPTGSFEEGIVFSIDNTAFAAGSVSLAVKEGDTQLWTMTAGNPGGNKRMSVIAHGKVSGSDELKPAVTIYGDSFSGAATMGAPLAAVATFVAALFASRCQ